MGEELRMKGITRRGFMEGCAAVALGSAAKAWGAMHTGAARQTVALDRGWLFGGKMQAGATGAGFNDAAFARIDLPHTVAPLSWQNWSPETWEDVWIYRRHFSVPEAWRGLRVFAHFDRVMAGATPAVNGQNLEPHLGGFLPFEREITKLIHGGSNVLAVAVDGRWLNAPPSGSPRGPASVDYLLPGGITGGVELRAVPAVFLREVYAKPVDALDAKRRLEITCRVDAAGQLPARVRLEAALRKNGRTIASAAKNTHVEKAGEELQLTMERLGEIALWDPDHPHLYDVEVTLFLDEQPVHRCATRIGFREARFELDGFFLNGERLRLFGLDRHELYPYLGFAAPRRLLRRDAEILRRRYNCNAVRCSHYPQSEAFMDACDELGLMVWEELPGWQYIGDESWQELAMRDIGAMVRRDRNHPAVIIWGVRMNESRNDPELYKRTRALAKSLDDTRPTSGR